MSAIKAGDLVQVVWWDCAEGRKRIGFTGTVVTMIPWMFATGCSYCGRPHHLTQARIQSSDGLAGLVPTAWLIKVDPPATPERSETEREVVA